MQELEAYMDKMEKAYREHAMHMKSTAFSILKDEHFAENAVHNVFENMIKRKSYRLNAEGAEAAYYLTVAVRNEAKRIYKKEYKNGYPDNIDDNLSITSPLTTEDIVFSKESLRLITDFIKHENPAYADLFIMHYWYRYTIKEISEMFNLSIPKVEKGIYRLKLKVLDYLRKEK